MNKKQCPSCKKFFIDDNSRYPKKYCSATCRKREGQRRFVKKNPNYYLVKKQINKCIVCGSEFETNIRTKKCCSKKCNTRDWVEKNRDRYNKLNRKHYRNNSKKIIEKHQKYQKTEKAKSLSKARYERDMKSGKRKEYGKNYYENLKKDPVRHTLWKIINHTRGRVREKIKTIRFSKVMIENKKYKKYTRKIEIVGCSLYELRDHIEEKFKPGMSWENYGTYWEIDHIIPISRFDLTIRSERNKANHYTNLQPLEADINRKLSDKKGII
ncbi:MAG: hypothetical protein MRY20_00360 [Pelagibacteraceae bacterium]|jgi:hypothetical protein|nr:hypothetical protein [Pelagibacteraceae bacterium]